MKLNKRNLLYLAGAIAILLAYFLEGWFGIHGGWQYLAFLAGGALIFWGYAYPPLDETE